MPTQPTNLNSAYSTNFRLQIDRFPNTTFFCQSVNLPSLTLNSLMLHTGHTQLPKAGTKLVYGQMSISFLVAEDMSDYQELAQWMQDISGSLNSDSFADNIAPKDEYSMGILTILSSKKNPIKLVKLNYIFPTNLGEMRFDNKAGTAVPMVGDVVFSIGNFEFSDP